MSKEKKYHSFTKCTAVIDCIVFGFEGNRLKILFGKRGLEPEHGKWSLIGGFVNERVSGKYNEPTRLTY